MQLNMNALFETELIMRSKQIQMQIHTQAGLNKYSNCVSRIKVHLLLISIMNLCDEASLGHPNADTDLVIWRSK